MENQLLVVTTYLAIQIGLQVVICLYLQDIKSILKPSPTDVPG